MESSVIFFFLKWLHTGQMEDTVSLASQSSQQGVVSQKFLPCPHNLTSAGML